MEESSILKNLKENAIGDSSSNAQVKEISKNHQLFLCRKCPRKFSSCFALYGHQNAHKREPKQRKAAPYGIKASTKRQTIMSNTNGVAITPFSGANNYPFLDPTKTLKLPSFVNSMQLPHAPPISLTNPTNAINGSSASSSLGAPDHSFFAPTNSIVMPSVFVQNHLLPNAATVAASHESMIHKPWQLIKQVDDGSSSSKVGGGGPSGGGHVQLDTDGEDGYYSNLDLDLKL